MAKNWNSILNILRKFKYGLGNNDKPVSLRPNVGWKNGERIAEILTGDQNKSGSVVPEFHEKER